MLVSLLAVVWIVVSAVIVAKVPRVEVELRHDLLACLRSTL